MRSLLILTAVTAATFAIFARTPADKARAKARYYLHAAIEELNGNNLYEYYELVKHASQADTSWSVAGAEKAKLMYQMSAFDALEPSDSAYVIRQFGRYVAEHPENTDQAMSYAYLLSKLCGDWLGAASVYEKIVEGHPWMTNVHELLIDAYINADSTGKALDALDRYERREGATTASIAKRTNIYLHSKDTVKAQDFLDSYLKSNTDNPDAWILKGVLAKERQQTDSAIKYYERALQTDPANSTLKYRMSIMLGDAGDTIRSGRLMGEVLEGTDIGPEMKEELLTNYVKANFRPGNDSTLLSLISRYKENELPTPELYDMEEIVRYTYNDTTGLLNMLYEKMDVMPADTNAVYSLMNYKLGFGMQDDVIREYPAMVKRLGKETPASMQMLMLAYNNNNDYKKAIEIALRGLREMLPGYDTSIDLYRGNDSIAALYLDIINKSIADQTLTANLAFTDMLVAANNFGHLKDTLQSANVFEQLIYLFPDMPTPYNDYAYMLALYGGDLDKAADMVTKALNSDSDNPAFLDTYAYILFKKKEYDRALLYQEKVVETLGEGAEDDKTNADLFDHYGDILFFNGKLDEAVASWEKALRLAPDNELIKRKITFKTYYEK